MTAGNVREMPAAMLTSTLVSDLQRVPSWLECPKRSAVVWSSVANPPPARTRETEPVEGALLKDIFAMPIVDKNILSKKKASVMLEDTAPAVTISLLLPMVTTVGRKWSIVSEYQVVASAVDPPIRALTET